jgi:hypothetical protein
MNRASGNLELHLRILRERLQHPTDYEKAFHYFLEEFAGDQNFIAQGVVEQAPQLAAVLSLIASRALGKEVQWQQTRISALPAFRFHHGLGSVDGRVALFFYFEEINSGLVAIIPGQQGEAELGRFRLPGGLGADPAKN